MRIYELPAFCLFEPAIWPIVECPPEGSKMKLHGEKKLLQLDINFECKLTCANLLLYCEKET